MSIRTRDIVHCTERLKSGVFSSSFCDTRYLMAWPAHLRIPDNGDTAQLLQELATTGRRVAGSDDDTTRRLRDGGWLIQEFHANEDCAPAFAVHPLRARAQMPEDSDTLDLSRFAVVRVSEGAFVIESPLATADIVVTARELLTSALRPDADGLAAALREQLRMNGFLAEPDGPESTELKLRQWSPHELWFHDRSRLGHRGFVGDSFGGTWWGKDAGLAAESARSAPYDGPQVTLPVPDLEQRRRTDPPYCEVTERRRSQRLHDDDHPITAEQLGELLYRTARVRRIRAEDGLEFVSAPRPAGGSVYELELYPLISLCAGLEAGLYHYDAHEHALEFVRTTGHPAVRRMLRVASHAATTARNPQVLIIVAARVGRVMWKYEGMGYGLILKNTGVLFDALGGACAAMGLAGCALGTDDTTAFTEATGRDPLLESTVGQFSVGSAKAGAA